jgi:hypothetical protein
VNHTASARFWRCFDSLLGGGKLYSARVGIHYRAFGLPRQDGVHWFWIGTHGEYDRLVDA